MRGARETVAERDLRAEIAALAPWFHNLHLPGGIETAPDHFLGDFPAFKWAAIKDHLPADLSGRRVLDIGCNAGFYSFALAERGAGVLGIDTDRHYLRQAEWAREVLDARRVRFQQASVYEADHLEGPFDIIFFMGVLYHLRHPLLALDLIARLKPAMMVFQTLTFGDEAVSPHAREESDFATRERLAEPSWPHMAFIEGRFCADPTNWWVPNHAAVMGMLRSAGFEVVAQPGHEIYLCRFAGGVEPEVEADLQAALLAVQRGERQSRGRTS
jgi:tRNA (mo5U34)-methyltransferase